MVERDLAKVEVAGSKPVSRSTSVSLRSNFVAREAGDYYRLDPSTATVSEGGEHQVALPE